MVFESVRLLLLERPDSLIMKRLYLFTSINVSSFFSSCWGAAVIYLAFLVLSGTFIGVNIWRSKVKAN